jgi:hypothetical protein
LAQTTTSQTILKHVTTKCRFCPEEIRQAILDYQQLSDMDDSPVGRPRYGSRKVFFQRIWQRLHHRQEGVGGGDVSTGSRSSNSSYCGEEEDATSLALVSGSSSGSKLALYDSASGETSSDLDEDHSLATDSNDTNDYGATVVGGPAPGGASLGNTESRAKDGSGLHWGGKQVKVTSPVHRLTAR